MSWQLKREAQNQQWKISKTIQIRQIAADSMHCNDLPEVIYNDARRLDESSAKERERVIPPFRMRDHVERIHYEVRADKSEETPCTNE